MLSSPTANWFNINHLSLQIANYSHRENHNVNNVTIFFFFFYMHSSFAYEESYTPLSVCICHAHNQQKSIIYTMYDI